MILYTSSTIRISIVIMCLQQSVNHAFAKGKPFVQRTCKRGVSVLLHLP